VWEQVGRVTGVVVVLETSRTSLAESLGCSISGWSSCEREGAWCIYQGTDSTSSFILANFSPCGTYGKLATRLRYAPGPLCMKMDVSREAIVLGCMARVASSSKR
jgi:hypothetical protein